MSADPPVRLAVLELDDVGHCDGDVVLRATGRAWAPAATALGAPVLLAGGASVAAVPGTERPTAGPAGPRWVASFRVPGAVALAADDWAVEVSVQPHPAGESAQRRPARPLAPVPDPTPNDGSAGPATESPEPGAGPRERPLELVPAGAPAGEPSDLDRLREAVATLREANATISELQARLHRLHAAPQAVRAPGPETATAPASDVTAEATGAAQSPHTPARASLPDDDRVRRSVAHAAWEADRDACDAAYAAIGRRLDAARGQHTAGPKGTPGPSGR